MNKKPYVFFPFVSAFVIAQILGACSTDDQGVGAADSSNTEEPTTTVTSQSEKSRTLAIRHTCTGCGRCLMIDREHFAAAGRQVRVVTQSNLGSTDLHDAIRSCPVGAIILS